MRIRAGRGLGISFMVLCCASLAVAASQPEREAAKRKLKSTYGDVTPETMLNTLNPPVPEDLRLFLAAGIPADGVLDLEVADQTVSVSPLQYVLMSACESEPVREVVAILLEAGADPNRRDRRDGGTPLMRATSCEGVVALLLKAGADPNLRTERGDTALQRAILFGTPGSMRLLIGAGADVKADQKRLLDLATRSDEKLKIIREALAPATRAASAKSGASRTLRDALRRRDVAGLRAGLESGAWRLEAVQGRPALLTVAHGCRNDEEPAPLVAVLALLLEKGEDVNGVAFQETALHPAARQCPVEAVRSLLAAGANPNVIDAGNQTPLLHAVMAGRVDVVEALLAGGAKADATTRLVAKGKPEIEKLLKKK